MNRKTYVLLIFTAIISLLLIDYMARPYLSTVSSEMGIFLSRLFRDSISLGVLIIISMNRLNNLDWPRWLVISIAPFFLINTIFFYHILFSPENLTSRVFAIYKELLWLSSILMILFLISMAIPRR